MNKIKRKLQLLSWHAYYDGWPLTFFRTAVKASEITGLQGTKSEWFQNLAEKQFDKRFHVATRGVVSTEQLGYSAEQKAHSVEYLPTRASSIAWLLSVLPIDYERFRFVDFGSGKGRVLLVAGQFPFHSVDGVELSGELHEIATRNIGESKILDRRCGRVTSVQVDAVEFELEEAPLVVFLYNPFSRDVLKAVVKKLLTATTEKSHPLVVIYHNPVDAELLESEGQLCESFQSCLPGHGWKIYVNQFVA